MQVVVQYCSITELAPLLDEDEDVQAVQNKSK